MKRTNDVIEELRAISSELAEERPRVADRLVQVADRLGAGPDVSGYIYTGEAAAALGVSANTVKKWVRLGLITDVWALPGSGYLKIARSEIERIRAAGAPRPDRGR